MPTHLKSTSAYSKHKFEPQPSPPETESVATEPDFTSRASKKNKKNAVGKKQVASDNEDKLEDDLAEVRPVANVSVTKPQSILNQLPSAFAKRPDSPNSDLLEGINGTQKVSDEHTPPGETWAHHIPYGKSPPSEAIARLSHGGTPPVLQPQSIGTGGFSTRIPTASPPQRKVRPVSYGGPSPVPGHARTSSSPYAFASIPYGSPPVLPHLPQPHFYSAQDVELAIPGSRLPNSTQEPYFHKLVRLPSTNKNDTPVVVVATEATVSVFSYPGDRIEQIGCLTIPAVMILDAEFLTWSHGTDCYADERPLLAIVSYGRTQPVPILVDGMSGFPDTTSAGPAASHEHDGEFETTVAVYSLASRRLISILLRIPATAQPSQFRGTSSQNAVPSGQLKVRSNGNFLIVSSGTSGELYVFSVKTQNDIPRFCCIGKFWTSIQPKLERRDSSHNRTVDPDVSPADLGRGSAFDDRPIVSSNGRWLAYCPPATSARPSLNGMLGEDVISSQFTGIESGSPPPRPTVNCEVESPDADTFLGKVAKGVAQEVLRSTKWLGEKGIQTWQNYWRKETSSPTSPGVSGYSSPTAHPGLPYNVFPPTHANDMPLSAKDHELVCIVDLQVLLDRQDKRGTDNYHVLATFQPPKGCSFLSFMPGGLSLMTAARHADVQYVWDLMQCKYRRTMPSITDVEASQQARCVRQIARYERVSPTSIVDVAWESPFGGRFAMLTHNRTVHLFDLPLSATKWPPARSINPARPTSAPSEPLTAAQFHDPPPSGGFLASAVNIAGKTQPILANLRGRAPSIGGGFGNIGATGLGFASATGVKGSKAVATGLSRSLGAASETVTSIRHAGQSRLALKHHASPGCLFWTHRGDRSVLSVVDSTAVRDYYVRKTKPRENSARDTVSVFDARRAVSTKLPRTASLGYDDMTGDVLPGFWQVRSQTSGPAALGSHPLAHAEIETSAPYQPFHSDPRVTLFVFRPGKTIGSSALLTPPETLKARNVAPPRTVTPHSSSEQWVFGHAIATSRLSLAPAHTEDSNGAGSVIYRETTIAAGLENNTADQIVSTTRRRKHRKTKSEDPNGSDEEGFFEDDCDILDFAGDRV